MKDTEHINIYTIAQRAGVSPATVSRALNHPEQIRPQTLEKVLKACGELGFSKRDYHSRSQGSLSAAVSPGVSPKEPAPTAASGDFLMVLAPARIPICSDIQEGAVRSAISHGCRLFTEYSMPDETTVNAYMESLSRHPFSGYLFTAPLPDAVLFRLRRKYHLVQCSEFTDTFPEVSYIGIDEYQAQCLAVNHVLDRGAKKPAYLSMPLGGHGARRRLQAFRDTLEARGVSIPERWIASLSQVSAAVACDAALHLLTEPAPPDAIVCGSDIYAAGCLKAAGKLGIRVPEALKIIGFDDSEIASAVTPAISTVRQPGSRLGYLAFETLYHEIRDPQPITPRHVLLQAELIVRETT